MSKSKKWWVLELANVASIVAIWAAADTHGWSWRWFVLLAGCIGVQTFNYRQGRLSMKEERL